jgi:ankyrin repeat protein
MQTLGTHMTLLFAVVLSLVTWQPAPSAQPGAKADELSAAARKGDAVTVKRLLDEGIDVNTRFRYGVTALFYACDHGHVDVVKTLLDRGADPNVKDTFYGMTPLMMAVSPAQKKRPEHTEIAKLLIKKGAAGKEMALSSAVDDGSVELAQAILDSGGLPPEVLSDSLESAKAQNQTEIVPLLERAGAKPYEDFKIDPRQLARLAGTYKNPAGAEVTVTVEGSRLRASPAGGDALVLSPRDGTAFRVIGMSGATVAFAADGDRVTGFTLNPPDRPPVTFSRVEGQ